MYLREMRYIHDAVNSGMIDTFFAGIASLMLLLCSVVFVRICICIHAYPATAHFTHYFLFLELRSIMH